MKKSKKWFLITTITTASCFFCLILVNFIVDPLQHYRKASFYKPYYKNSRYLNPGIAKNYDYNTVIIGTSMVQNFRPSYIDKLWGVKSVKLPWPGASAYELGITMETALRTGKVKRVIYCLDVFSFKGPTNLLSSGPGSIPLYLYDDNIFNDINYLINIDTLEFYKYIIKANLFNKNSRYLDHDNFGFFGHKFNFSKEEVLKDWQKATFNKGFSKGDWELRNLTNNYEKNLLSYINDNPNIEFDIFFPPYSILAWVDSKERGITDVIFEFKKYVLSRTSGLPNVRVFDFQNIEKIILDLDNYKDISHYSAEINDFMVESIAKESFLVDRQNYDKIQVDFFKLVDAQAEKYRR